MSRVSYIGRYWWRYEFQNINVSQTVKLIISSVGRRPINSFFPYTLVYDLTKDTWPNVISLKNYPKPRFVFLMKLLFYFWQNDIEDHCRRRLEQLKKIIKNKIKFLIGNKKKKTVNSIEKRWIRRLNINEIIFDFIHEILSFFLFLNNLYVHTQFMFILSDNISIKNTVKNIIFTLRNTIFYLNFDSKISWLNFLRNYFAFYFVLSAKKYNYK